MTHDLGDDDSERDFETLRGIRRVAVIGAGASGCPAARHLREHGLAVRVFERQAQAGGIWAWSPDVARLELPTPPPSRAAFDPARPEHGPFSPPNPVYANLSNNVPTSTMVVGCSFALRALRRRGALSSLDSPSSRSTVADSSLSGAR